MKPHRASGLLLLLSTAALGCDSGDDGADAETATTSGTTSDTTAAPETSSTTTGSATSTGEGTSSTGEPGSSGGSSSGSGGSSSSTAGATGSTGGGSPLCNEHGNVVEKCTDASYEYGVGYCEYAIEAGEAYSAECGEAWEALFLCVNGVDCKDFGIEDVPGCENEEKKLDSLCP